MNLRQFLAIVRARSLLAAAVFLVTVSCAIVVGLMLPKKYTATTTLIVDQSRPDPVAGAANWRATNAGYLSTQMDVMRSERVALEVVDRLPPAQMAELREKWQSATQGRDDMRTWMAQSLQKTLDVALARDSDVVALRVSAEDPAVAAMLANAFAKAYLDVVVQLRVDPAKQYSTFFEARAKSARSDLEAAQARLASFQREKGIVVSDDRLDIESSRLNELSSQLTVMQSLVAESGSRQAQAQGVGANRLPEVMSSPAVANISNELLRAEGRLQELNGRLGDAHPQVQEARNQISLLRQRLETETRRVAGGVSVINSINMQREAELRGSMEAQRAKVLRLKSVRDEGQVLLRDTENAQRAYESVLAKLNQASLESHATQGQTRVLAQASAPLTPSSPRVLITTALAAVLGALLALAAVIAFEMADPRLRTEQAAAATLGLKVLGVLPKPHAKGDFMVRRAPLVSARSLPRLTASTVTSKGHS